MDIPGCSYVVRFDLPKGVRSWVQSRGRARKRKSVYVVLVDRSVEDGSLIQKLEEMEREMVKRYQEERERNVATFGEPGGIGLMGPGAYVGGYGRRGGRGRRGGSAAAAAGPRQ